MWRSESDPHFWIHLQTHTMSGNDSPNYYELQIYAMRIYLGEVKLSGRSTITKYGSTQYSIGMTQHYHLRLKSQYSKIRS